MSFFSFLGAAERQANPFDNNATAKNPQGNGQRQSTFNQVKNTGWNFLKGAAQPFVAAGADVSNAIGNAEVKGAQAIGIKAKTGVQTNQQQFGNTLGKYVGQNTPVNFAKDVGQIGINLAGGPAVRASEKVATGVFGFLAPKIASQAVGGAAAKAALGVGGELLPKGISTATKFASGPIAGAAVGGPYNTLGGGSFAQGALGGATLGTIAEGAPLVARGAVKGAQAVAENAGPLNEAGSTTAVPGAGDASAHVRPVITTDDLHALTQANTIKDVQKILSGIIDPATVSKIAPAIIETKQPGAIDNIITRTINPEALNRPEQVPVDTTTPPPILPPEAPKNAPDEAINQHLQTISNAQSTTPELQEAIQGLKQTHEVRDTQNLSDQAKAAVEKDYTGSLTKVLTAENPNDKEIALGEHLIVKAQQEGKTGEAVNITETLDKNLREHGRAVQAASIIGRLSPEGQLLRATRVIRKIRESNPENITKEQNTAKEIQQTVEGSVPPLDRAAVHQAVKDVSNDQQKLDLGGAEGPTQAVDNTGKALAKNVERAATPQIKKKADALVAELTKKVKQEYLPIPGHVMKSPLQTLKEVFARHGEAEEAYPLAQKILREKYANVPHMQEALDKFFGSKLDLPAASSTVDRAISEQLKNNGQKIGDIIYKSLQEQKTTSEEVAKDLVKEGFDSASATKLSEEVGKRLNQQVADAKRAALERLGQDVKEKNQPTFLDKINKFSNLGALDNHDYLQLARAKLDLPHLKEETANKVHELSQQLQSLPEGHEKYAVVRELQRTIASDIPKSKMELVKEFAGLPRTILASGDFSFGFRQGLVYATSHPITFMKEWPKQFKYFTQAFKGNDSEAYDAMMADVRNNPDYKLLEKYGRLLEPEGHDVNSRSEQFLSSDLAEKIPLAGRLVRGSNYAFAGLNNTLYANQFYGMLDHLRYADIKPTEPMLKQMAEVIGTTLGRGGKAGGFTEKHAGFLSTTLFAPRLLASRLNVMNPAYYIRLKGPARLEALRGLMGLSAFAVAVLGTAKLAGAKVSTDPRNADFGKIRVGDTRFDVLGGFTQYIRLGAELSTGQKINSTSGAETEVGKGLAGSRLDIASNFIQGKENPTVSFVTTLLKGKDISGNSIYNAKGITEQVAQRFIPLLAQDMSDLITHQHSAGPAAGIAGLFGVGLQTYGAQDSSISAKQTAYIQQLQKDGAPKDKVAASKSFFQTIKTVPPKTQIYGEIDAALKAGNQDKAAQLARDYNNQFAKAFDDWRKQYPQYRNDPTLTDSYTSRQITDDELQNRIDKVGG